jgi:hypothetical protein
MRNLIAGLKELAKKHPEVREDLVAVIKASIKKATRTVDADKLPKPNPWNTGVPWDEGKQVVAANMQKFINVGAQLRKIKPLAYDYALFYYRGFPFTMNVLRKMPSGTYGNLFSEESDMLVIVSKLPYIINLVKYTINSLVQPIDPSSGYKGTISNLDFRNLIKRLKTIAKNRWQLMIAVGIVQSMLAYQAVSVSESFADDELIVTEEE